MNSELINYQVCKFYDEFSGCGPHKGQLKEGIFLYDELQQKVLGEFTEAQLINNRSKGCLEDGDAVCAFHRYKFGTSWQSRRHCYHPLHKETNFQSTKKRQILRPAPADMAHRIYEKYGCWFPVGGNICTNHRKLESRNKQEDVPQNENSADESYEPPPAIMSRITKEDLDILVDITTEGISPVKYQILSPVEDLCPSTIRYSKRKYTQIMDSFRKKLCEALAPGQGLDLETVVSSNNSEIVHPKEISPQMENLITAYREAINERTKTLILTAVPHKQYSRDEVTALFDCSKNKVDAARKWIAQHGTLSEKPIETYARRNLNMDKVEHFVTYLFESGAIQDVAYGTKVIKYNSGNHDIVPRAVLTTLRNHTIISYEKYCSEISYVPLSKSSLWRILNTVKPNQRQALAGLDNTTADGIRGFETLTSIVNKVANLDSKMAMLEKTMLQKLESGKRYLKLGYRVHCAQETSTASSHCCACALSNPNDASFQVEETHDHNGQCADCVELYHTLDEIRATLSTASLEEEMAMELQYDLDKSVEAVCTWVFHVIRGVQQDKAKARHMENLDCETAFWIRDWAQKIIPRRYREGQKEYFGKKGMSLHVDVFFFKCSTELRQMDKQVYFTSIHRCEQDMVDTLCVADHVLQQLHEDYPHIKNLFLKSDNAGCYAANGSAEAEYRISKTRNFILKRHDYSEPQHGKDQADRESATAKRCLEAYINTGHDVFTPDDVKLGLQYMGGPKNSKVSVVEINKDVAWVKNTPKIQNIHSYHSIQFEEEGIRFWQYFDIGPGKIIPYEGVKFKSGTEIISPFTSSPLHHQAGARISQKLRTDRQYCPLLFCMQEGCTAAFTTESKLDNHISLGKHKYNELKSTSDKVKHVYAEKLRIATILHTGAGAHQSSQGTLTVPTQINPQIVDLSKLGWALPKRKQVRFSFKQKKFLYDIFMEGEVTKKKSEAQKVVITMRTQRDKKGMKVFLPHEYCSKDQVTSLFSRMACLKKAGKLLEPQLRLIDEYEVPTFRPTKEENAASLMANIQECVSAVGATNLDHGEYVYVSYGKSGKKHFVGKVLNVPDDEDDVEVKFMKKQGNHYVWPGDEDVAWVKRKQIHIQLQVPIKDSQQREIFTDKENTAMMNCCK